MGIIRTKRAVYSNTGKRKRNIKCVKLWQIVDATADLYDNGGDGKSVRLV